MRRQTILPFGIMLVALLSSLLPACAPFGPVVYRNTQYGFSLALLPTWRGYSVVTANWEGFAAGVEGGGIIQTGPLILIRHPEWTAANPRQDIPIMVFSHSQWALIQQQEMYVSAAGVPPPELGRNADYVFALPPRYNYAYLPGWQEVEALLERGSFHTP